MPAQLPDIHFDLPRIAQANSVIIHRVLTGAHDQGRDGQPDAGEVCRGGGHLWGWGHGRAPPTVGQRPGKGGDVGGLQPADFETTTSEQRRDVSRQMQATEQPVHQRFQAFLPAPDGGIGRLPELEEDKRAARFQDAFDPFNRLLDVWNRAQGEGADDRVDGAVREGNLFSGKVDEFDGKASRAHLFRTEDHLRIGFERVEFGDAGRIVVGKVGAGADADLEDDAVGEGDDLAANVVDGWRVA